MKLAFLKSLKIIALLLFPSLIFGQDNNSIHLKSGIFIPEENFSALLTDPTLVKPALYNGKYYAVIQFKSLPTEKEKDALKLNDIHLIDYLPKNAYTAIFPSNIFFKCLKGLPIRSIFYLNTQQKMSKELMDKKYPHWAIKEKGNIDVNVIVYENLPDSLLIPALLKLKAQIIERQPIYKTLTLRLPTENIIKLAEIPFIQWIEAIPPPDQTEVLNR